MIIRNFQQTSVTLTALVILLSACSQDFLDVKYDKRVTTPESIKDFWAILDSDVLFNQNMPNLGEISSADFFINDDRWHNSGFIEKNTYIWSSEIFNPMENSKDWNEGYNRIYHTNIVLEGLKKMETNTKEFNEVLGTALFHRANAFFELIQTFTLPFSNKGNEGLLGLPIRTSTNLNEKFHRSSLSESYDQIKSDLLTAIPLLPKNIMYKTRPSKAAGYALMARLSLQMYDYDLAYKYADSCLNLHNMLLDFSELNINNNYSFERFNKEVIFHSTMISSTLFSQSVLQVVPELLDLYAIGDLRKDLFFRFTNNQTTFKGSYNGSALLFNGLSTSEIILIRAESLCRNGNVSDALKDLNTLLEFRHDNSFIPLYIEDKKQLLDEILQERRKELVFRGNRWRDLRRLNNYDNYAVKLERQIGEEKYSLDPNDIRYALPIPFNAIIKGKLIQNER